MLSLNCSVNHKLPSGPVAILMGPAAGVEIVNSRKLPAVVIRPILFPFCSVNHRAPSGPAVMPVGPLLLVGTVNVVTVFGLLIKIRPILLAPVSVNHRFPSAPAAMPLGPAPAASGNSVTEPATVIRPI